METEVDGPPSASIVPAAFKRFFYWYARSNAPDLPEECALVCLAFVLSGNLGWVSMCSFNEV
ncbi:TPA: hypothetical protein ACT5CD_003677, partial [Burkholderia cenocepacia]